MTERNPSFGAPGHNSDLPTEHDEPFDAAERRAGVAHAAVLKSQAEAGGLRFEAYLPSGLAVWLLRLIEKGQFRDPSEAVFVMLDEQRDLADYPDLRAELLLRTLEAAEADPRPPVPAETVFAELDRILAAPRPPAAVWNSSVTRLASGETQ